MPGQLVDVKEDVGACQETDQHDHGQIPDISALGDFMTDECREQNQEGRIDDGSRNGANRSREYLRKPAGQP